METPIDPKTGAPAATKAGIQRAERAAKQQAQRRSEAGKIARQTQLRKQWEGSPEGAERLQGAPERMGTKADVGLIYQTRGWGETSKGARHYEQQLPGMENPDALPTPPRWEDLPDEERAKSERALKIHAGADVGFMERAFGAQLDQAYMRAERNTPPENAAVPHTRDFYTEREDPSGKPLPRGVMEDSAKEIGMRFGQYTAVSAITSPQTKFSTRTRTGETRYPNDDTARSAVEQARSGVPVPEGGTGIRPDGRGKNEGYPANARKAIDATQQFDEGVSVPEVRSRWKEDRKSGEVVPRDASTPMFGPKTGPYHNSWMEDTPDYFVSDVHSGGGGMLPHLSSYKGSNEGGKKSQRETAIERTPHFHAAADFAARQAMTKRGLGSIRQTQASQWGEEQIQRKEGNARLQGSLTEKQAYGHLQERPAEDPYQGRLDFEAGEARSGRVRIPPKRGQAIGLSQEQLEKNYKEDF